MTRIQTAAAGVLAALAGVAMAEISQAADLTSGYQTAPIVGAPVVSAPVGVPLAGVMYSPVRNWRSLPIQTHIIAQPAPNPRAIGEGPVFGPAYPVIIVVKP